MTWPSPRPRAMGPSSARATSAGRTAAGSSPGPGLRIRPDQIVELSDVVYLPAQPPGAKGGRPAGPQPVPTTKPVLEKTISDFLAGCRAQDRILLLYAGHAVSLGDDAYLVPVE